MKVFYGFYKEEKMKNWGKFFMMVLMILAMTACGEKGGGSTGGTVYVSANTDLAKEVSNNITYINNMLNSSTTYKQEAYLRTVVSELTKIVNAYTSGDQTEAYINTAYNSAKNYASLFYSANDFLGKSQIDTTYLKIVSYNQNSGSNNSDLNNAEDKLKYYVTEMAKDVSNNEYFIEVSYALLVNKFLDSGTVTNSDIDYRDYLTNLGLLDDKTLADKYAELAKIVKKDLDILNGIGTKNLDDLVATNAVTNYYEIKSVLENDLKEELKKELTTLYTIYSNYQNYTDSEIIKAETTFRSVDNSVWGNSESSHRTYYQTSLSNGGVSLNISDIDNSGQVLADGYWISYFRNLEKNETDTTIKGYLTTLIGNIEKYQSLIENYYSMYSPSTVYSKSVVNLQLYQLLIDGKMWVEGAE